MKETPTGAHSALFIVLRRTDLPVPTRSLRRATQVLLQWFDFDTLDRLLSLLLLDTKILPLSRFLLPWYCHHCETKWELILSLTQLRIMMMGTNLGENEAITEPRKSSNSNWSAAGAANCTSGGSQPSTHANDIPVGVNYSLMVPPNYHAATYGAPVAPQFNTYVGSSATYEPNHSLMPGNYPVPPPPPSQYYRELVLSFF